MIRNPYTSVLPDAFAGRNVVGQGILLILVSDRNRSMLLASPVLAATSSTGELDLKDPLRSFTPIAGKEVDGTHQDAESLAPIVCVASCLQPMIEFPAISEQFPVQHESPVREVLPNIEKDVAKEVIAINRREVPVKSGGYFVPQFGLWHE